jgi:hypothetical protein
MELTIRIPNEGDLRLLLPLLHRLGIQIVSKPNAQNPDSEKRTDLPVTWAKEPDIMPSAGMWKGFDIDAETLRSEAWGNRL